MRNKTESLHSVIRRFRTALRRIRRSWQATASLAIMTARTRDSISFAVLSPCDHFRALCSDVLIHQTDPNAHRRMLRRLVARTGMLGLISGFSGPPPRESTSAITFSCEPLSLTLQAAGAANTIKVMEYGAGRSAVQPR